MSDSGERSRRIYEELGVDGLEARTAPQWDQLTVDRVNALLRASEAQRVLDAGCGYGRMAVPLAEVGFDVVGVDVSAMMLAEARRRAVVARVDVDLRHGDLCQLPCEDAEFDAVVCMWLTFNELMEEPEQLAALREMCRVLRPGGWALLDGPPYLEAEDNALPEQPHEVTVVPQNDLDFDLQSSAVGRRYQSLMQAVHVERHELFIDDCPGLPRYFFRFWPSGPR